MTNRFADLATPGVIGLTPYQPGKPMTELERELGIDDIIKLASNENPLGPGDAARVAAGSALGDLGRYPDGNGFALKHALARHYDLEPAQITLGNGSNDVLELLTRALVTPVHEVVFSEHAFAVYPIVTQAVGARAVVTPARDYGHDLEAMAAAVTDATRVMFIANPNNPTGTWSDAGALRRLLEAVPERVIVVVDEAYSEYVEQADYPHAVAWLADFPNLVVMRTFSKAYGLAGLRAGYALSHADLADYLNRVRQPFNVNSIALAAAEAALADSDHVRRSVALNRDELQRLTRTCEAMGLEYIPSVGNFLCIRVGTNAGEIYQALLERGVIVRPVANYGLPEHLRVTVGTASENSRFIAALQGTLAARSGA